MNMNETEIITRTDIDGLQVRLPFGSRQYLEVQQAEAARSATARWHLLAEVRDAAPRRGLRR